MRTLYLTLIRLSPGNFRERFGDDLELTLDSWLHDVPVEEQTAVLARATFDLARTWPLLWVRSDTPYVTLLSLIGGVALMIPGAAFCLNSVNRVLSRIPVESSVDWLLMFLGMSLVPMVATLFLAATWRRLLARR